MTFQRSSEVTDLGWPHGYLYWQIWQGFLEALRPNTWLIFHIEFEQTVESELKDSLGEYETAVEKNSRDRRADAVRNVICDVTPLKCQFLGLRMETKSCNHARSAMEEGAQAVAKSLCEWQKHFGPLPGRPEDPGLVTREHRGAHPARHLVPQLSQL